MSQYNHIHSKASAHLKTSQYNKDATIWSFNHSIFNSSPSKVLLFLSLQMCHIKTQGSHIPYPISKRNRSSVPILKHSSYNFWHHPLDSRCNKTKILLTPSLRGNAEAIDPWTLHPICKQHLVHNKHLPFYKIVYY